MIMGQLILISILKPFYMKDTREDERHKKSIYLDFLKHFHTGIYNEMDILKISEIDGCSD